MRSVPTRTAASANRVTLISLAVPLGLAVLAGCSSPRHPVSTSAGAASPPPTVAPSTGAVPPVAATGTAAGGAGPAETAAGSPGATVLGGSAAAAAPAHRGSVTVAVAKPVLARGQAIAPVTCETSSAVYVALISKAQAGGYRHSFTVRVAGYRGPGRYRGTLSATVTGPHGPVAALTGVIDPAVTVTATGGSFTIDTTGTGDHSLDATVSWVCP